MRSRLGKVRLNQAEYRLNPGGACGTWCCSPNFSLPSWGTNGTDAENYTQARVEDRVRRVSW